MFQIQPSVFEH